MTIHTLTNAVHTAVFDADLANSTPSPGAPSNQQVLDAAKQAYSLYQKVVDSSTEALVNIVSTGSMTTQIQDLSGTNWRSGGIDDKIVDPFFASPDVRTAIGVARTEMATYLVGTFSNALPDGKVGVAGFARSLTGQTHSGVMLEIDLYRNVVDTDPSTNLQFAQFLGDPADLHTNLYGMYANTTVRGVSVDLKILMDQSLRPYGFFESTGAHLQLPVQVSPFAGATSIF